MIEGDILKIEGAEHHVGQHGASAPAAHSGGIAPHAPEIAHGDDKHAHHEPQTESTERNGGNDEK